MTLAFVQTEMGAEPVIAEGLFPVTVERLFRAWTERDEFARWFAPADDSVEALTMDLCIDGRWTLQMRPENGQADRLTGRYLTIEQDKRLVFTWQHYRTFDDGRTESTAESQVTVEFEPHGNAARLRLTHEQIVSHEGREGVGKGWNRVLQRLNDLIAAQATDSTSAHPR